MHLQFLSRARGPCLQLAPEAMPLRADGIVCNEAGRLDRLLHASRFPRPAARLPQVCPGSKPVGIPMGFGLRWQTSQILAGFVSHIKAEGCINQQSRQLDPHCEPRLADLRPTCQACTYHARQKFVPAWAPSQLFIASDIARCAILEVHSNWTLAYLHNIALRRGHNPTSSGRPSRCCGPSATCRMPPPVLMEITSVPARLRLGRTRNVPCVVTV